MPDSENVIKAIEICYTAGHNCTECPLFNEDDCNDRLMRDALALLREHEAVKPKRVSTIVDTITYFVCGSCGMPIGLTDRYCSHCGKKVKRDG